MIVRSCESIGNDGKPLLLAAPLRQPDIDVCEEESGGMKREGEEKRGREMVEKCR